MKKSCLPFLYATFTLCGITLPSFAQDLANKEELAALHSFSQEQPESIQKIADEYGDIFNAFGKHNDPRYDDFAEIIFGLSFYAETLEDGISHEERLNSRSWKILLAFISTYACNEQKYRSLPTLEKQYLRTFLRFIIDVCQKASASTKNEQA